MNKWCYYVKLLHEQLIIELWIKLSQMVFFCASLTKLYKLGGRYSLDMFRMALVELGLCT